MDTGFRVTLKPGRDESVRRRHPWIFSGAVEKVHGSPAVGDTVAVQDQNGRFLAYAAYSPASQIRLRVWTFHGEAVDAAFFRNRLQAAIAMRQRLGFMDPAGACRLVYSESDGLPGLIVDRYGDTLQYQLLSAGAERWRDTITELLQELCEPSSVCERSVGAARKKEGLASRQGLVAGNSKSELTEIRTGKLRMLIDPAGGQKTGAYLDQQQNQVVVAKLMSRGTVLDAFSYTGGFALQALANGAEQATLIESSSAALGVARRQAELNGLTDRIEYLNGDAFGALRELVDGKSRYDLVVLDPPKFVHSVGDLRKGTRAYKDINRLAMMLVESGGILATFSCSGRVGPELFQKIVASAAVEAGRRMQIIDFLHQPADHPVLVDFPESLYLKGLLLRAE